MQMCILFLIRATEPFTYRVLYAKRRQKKSAFSVFAWILSVWACAHDHTFQLSFWSSVSLNNNGIYFKADQTLELSPLEKLLQVKTYLSQPTRSRDIRALFKSKLHSCLKFLTYCNLGAIIDCLVLNPNWKKKTGVELTKNSSTSVFFRPKTDVRYRGKPWKHLMGYITQWPSFPC